MVSPTGSQPSLAGTQASGSNSSLAGSQASGSSNASSGSLTRTQSLPNLTSEASSSPIQRAHSWPQMSLKQSCSLSSSLKALSGRNDAGSTRSSSPYDPESPKPELAF